VSLALQVPEPSTIILMGLVLLALVAIGWMRARRSAPRPPKKTP